MITLVISHFASLWASFAPLSADNKLFLNNLEYWNINCRSWNYLIDLNYLIILCFSELALIVREYPEHKSQHYWKVTRYDNWYNQILVWKKVSKFGRFNSLKKDQLVEKFLRSNLISKSYSNLSTITIAKFPPQKLEWYQIFCSFSSQHYPNCDILREHRRQMSWNIFFRKVFSLIH